MEAVVKDFQELDNKNVLSEEKYQETVDALMMRTCMIQTLYY